MLPTNRNSSESRFLPAKKPLYGRRKPSRNERRSSKEPSKPLPPTPMKLQIASVRQVASWTCACEKHEPQLRISSLRMLQMTTTTTTMTTIVGMTRALMALLLSSWGTPQQARGGDPAPAAAQVHLFFVQVPWKLRGRVLT